MITYNWVRCLHIRLFVYIFHIGDVYKMSEEEEEEAVDIRPRIVEECKALGKNSKLWTEYVKCAERIEKKGHGECTGQYFDFWKSMDQCVRNFRLFGIKYMHIFVVMLVVSSLHIHS